MKEEKIQRKRTTLGGKGESSMDLHYIELQKKLVNYQLGQFIHFNSATEQFNVMPDDVKDWEFQMENRTGIRKYPFDEKTWNPYKLDCRQWADATVKLGAKFACLTAKHHEGFCIWPTKTTEHCVRNATCTRDVVGEYLEAYRSAGIDAGLYFSMLDLNERIGRHHCTREQVEFTKAQLEELLVEYGKIPFLIIDGWHANWGGPRYEKMDYEEMEQFIKSFQPDCLILNHSCEHNLDHTDIVFYENAAGRNPRESFVGPGAGGNILTNHWFWKASDPEMELKSVEWVMERVRNFNAHNTAFLVNASPNKYGLIDDNMVQRFEEIGKAMEYRELVTDIPEGWMTKWWKDVYQ